MQLREVFSSSLFTSLYIRRKIQEEASGFSSGAKFLSALKATRSDSGGETMTNVPNHALQRTAASRHCCNRRAPWPPSLSLVVRSQTRRFQFSAVIRTHNKAFSVAAMCISNED
jgi:hypothetical protein